LAHDGHDDTRLDLFRGLALAVLGFDTARRYLLAPATYASDELAFVLLVRAPGLLAVLLLVFLQGLDTFIRSRTAPATTLSRSLMLGGLVLIALELTLVRAVAWFTLDYTRAIGVLEVYWILGVSMLVLAILVHLTVRDAVIFAVVTVAWFMAAAGLEPPGRYGPGTAPGLGGQIWILLHGPAEIFRPVGTSGPVIGLIHPALPFAGVAAAGYAAGAIRHGVGSRAAWRWLVAPAASSRSWHSVPSALGRVPWFCYVVQVFAIHLLAVGVTAVAGRDVGYLFVVQPFEGRLPEGSGFGLSVVLGCWLAGLLVAYAACRAAAGPSRAPRTSGRIVRT
jgi:uncharacterized membrane protein